MSEASISLADELDVQRGPAVDTSSIRLKVRAHIVDNLLLGTADDFDDNTELMEAGILDSTGSMELVAFLETTFAIAIEDDEIIPENLNSLARICNFIVQKSN
jgi:acyl carrier protein